VRSIADQRLLVVSPVRNEAGHLERVAQAMAAQTRPPDLWIVVDDGSTDGTSAILARIAEETEWLAVCRDQIGAAEVRVRDRLATAAAPRAFNRGLGSVAWRGFTHIAKLDGDIELPARYFELLLARFAADPQLGIAGGVRAEPSEAGWTRERPPLDYHVPGALKCYTRECFERIGGVHERLGWDTIDELYARMNGYRTRAFPDLIAVHHRPWGSADGALRGRLRHGRCSYIVHHPLPWVLARAFKPQPARPRALSALCYVGGYGLAAIRRTERVEDGEFRAFMRRELGARTLRALGAERVARRVSPAPRSPLENQLTPSGSPCVESPA
jgi:GT2 family glycosyltransferase